MCELFLLLPLFPLFPPLSQGQEIAQEKFWARVNDTGARSEEEKSEEDEGRLPSFPLKNDAEKRLLFLKKSTY